MTANKKVGNQSAASGKVLLTAQGLAKLKAELEHLKNVKRREVAKRLKEAISYGDLSENSEYEEAKNEQAFCEGRIVELEKMIKNVEIIDEKTAARKAAAAGTVVIGSTVEVENLDKKEVHKFTIVGSTEADPFASKISNESPIGSQLLGKRKGDKLQVNAPGGLQNFKILAVK